MPWDAYVKYGAENKVLFATDYPLRGGFKDTLTALKSLNLPSGFESKILGENAMALLQS